MRREEEMNFNKVRLSRKATNYFPHLVSRTGLRPNIICRLGFCYSLNEAGIPEPEEFDRDGKEFNRYTLTGEWDTIFMALLSQWGVEAGIDNPRWKKLFEAHLNRGVLMLANHLKDITDILTLLPKNLRSF